MKRKVLAVGIILLFVATGIIPSTISESLPPTDSAISVLEIPVIDIDAISVKAPGNNGSWGFIISKKFALSYTEIWENISGDIVWWGAPTIDFTVIGIGKHTIHYTCNYSIYTYESHVPQPQNGSFNSSNDLYLLNLHKKPIIKIRASTSGMVPFFLFKKGTWVGKLYIDGTLVETEQFSWEHH